MDHELLEKLKKAHQLAEKGAEEVTEALREIERYIEKKSPPPEEDATGV